MTPFELAAKHLIPRLRALAAAKLLGDGMSQSEAARRLGVTQPMVKKYAAEAEEAMAALESMGIPRGAAEAMASALADAAARGYWEHLSAMNSIVASVLSGGSLCAFHRRIDRGVPDDCSLCQDVLKGGRDQYVEDVENALSMVLESPYAYLMIPEVGMNVALAPPGALTVEQVIGVPGRIVRVGTRAVAVGRPSYGGSVHTAKVALWAASRWGFPRAAVAARYNEAILRAATEMGLRVQDADGEIAVEPDVLVDRGGPGVEPIVYFLGRSAVEAARKALEVARRVGEAGHAYLY